MRPLIHLTGDIYIPSYILIISIAYCLGIVWSIKRAKKLQMSVNECINICFCVMFGGFFGARIFHVLYEVPEFYFKAPFQLLKIWQGGFVFYGGAIGALTTSAIWIRKRKLDFWAWADLFTPIFSAGYILGRFACFMNGCCYGAICDLPWAIHNPTLPENPDVLRHPTQLYVILWELFTLALLLHLEYWSRKNKALPFDLITQKFKKMPTGTLFLIWGFFHAVGRIVMEAFRDDPRGDFVFGISISTGISIMIIAATLSLLIARKNR